MIRTICVCGSGTMGGGIAQVAAMAGFQTLIFDVDRTMLDRAKARIESNCKKLEEKNKLSSQELHAILDRLQYIDDPAACKADLIIEAIVERHDLKKALFNNLAAINGPETIFCSNTSSLSVTHLAEQMPDPGRFAGMHFFNPAPLMRLVEVVTTPHTSEHTREMVVQVARQMGKTPVLCKDHPGFIVNHVARPYYLEALRLVEAGISDFATIDYLMEASGFKMGPFRLMDLIGNDINLAVSTQVFEALGRPERLKPSSIQEEKVRQGALGVKSGQGYYSYPKTS